MALRDYICDRRDQICINFGLSAVEDFRAWNFAFFHQLLARLQGTESGSRERDLSTLRKAPRQNVLRGLHNCKLACCIADCSPENIR